jgi:hypothetical protein
MITNENLDNLVIQLAEISKIARQHNLDDLTLSKPLGHSKEKLHFVISRREKLLPLDEAAKIYMDLCALIKVGLYEENENVVLEIKEIFKPGCFEEEYGEELSFKKDIDQEKAVTFIKEKLGFEYAPHSILLKQPEKEKDEKKIDSTTSSLLSSTTILMQKTEVSGTVKKKRPLDKSHKKLAENSEKKIKNKEQDGSIFGKTSFYSHLAGSKKTNKLRPETEKQLNILINLLGSDSIECDIIAKLIQEHGQRKTLHKSNKNLAQTIS